MRREDLIGKINAYKSLLNNSDYEIIKLAEGLADCSTIAQITSYFSTFKSEFGTLVEKRIAWRKAINDLEAELENLPEDVPEEEAEDVPEEEAESEE